MPSSERALCPLTHDVLDAWLDGQSGGHAAHVAGCPSCAAALNGYQRLSGLLRSAVVPDPAPGACAAILRALPTPRTGAPRIAARILAPAAALCILAIAFGSWMLLPRGEGDLTGGVHWRATRRPIPEAWAVLLSGKGVVAVQSTAPMGGGFRFEHLSAGRYQVVPIVVGAVLPTGAPVTVEARRAARLPLWLEPAAAPQTTASVAGVVTDLRTHTPIAAALVVLVQNGGVVSATVTGSDGRYTLPSPDAGAIAVRAYAAGCEVLTVDLAAPASGESLPLDLQLPGS